MFGMMIWRAAAAFAVLFWTVMTGLLVRDVYFPDDSRFAEVPPGMIFDRFLQQAEVNAGTLHLFHGAEKIGHASLTLSSSRVPSGGKRYHWMVRGVVERLQSRGERVDITWEITGMSDGMGEWQQMEFTASVPRQEITVKMAWAEGEASPSVKITRAGRPVLDTPNAGLLMALGLAGMQGAAGSEWAQALMPLKGGTGAGTSFHFTAREGGIELAGRVRRCFLLSAPLPGGQRVRMIFAGAGELARIELPQDYLLIEPLVHGMIPPVETLPENR
jgi:hypothetical protein